AYTTTHDTETIVGYLEILTAEQKRTLSEVSNVKYDPENKIFAKRIRDALINSPADMVIFPIQDWLLTTERINIPGTEREIGDPNWKYKLITPVENLPGI
ncbi:MAG TPA: 4-alpha-glucanotransferase, partial [Xanthomonadales bacterium]|nr:4-alpha-glucanotransferase [Xanthomonadales bacterium]